MDDVRPVGFGAGAAALRWTHFFDRFPLLAILGKENVECDGSSVDQLPAAIPREHDPIDLCGLRQFDLRPACLFSRDPAVVVSVLSVVEEFDFVAGVPWQQ